MLSRPLPITVVILVLAVLACLFLLASDQACHV